MKKKIISFFLLLFFCNPLSSNASPRESIDLIVKAITKEDYVGAEKLVYQSLKIKSEDVWRSRALYLKAHISKKLSKLNDAVDIYLRLLPEYPELRDYILLKLAEAYMEEGEESKSLELLNRLLRDFPKSRLVPHAKFYLGKLYFNRGELEKAHETFAALIKNYPKTDLVPESMFFVGIILEKQKKIINAYETYMKIFHHYPLNEFAMKAEEKIREMKMAKIKVPEFPPSLISKRIELLMNKGEFSLASRECKKYLKIYKKGRFFQDLTFNLAKAYNSMRKREEVLQIYKPFIAKYPTSSRVPEALYKTSTTYWNLGNHSKAIAYSKKVINKFPYSSYAERAYYNMGRISIQNKRYSQAISQFQKMAKIFPRGTFAASAHWQIGWINYITGDYRAAAKKFAEAATRYHDSELRDMFLYWAGKANEKTGENKIARSFYKKVAKEYPYDYYGHRGKVKLIKESGNKVKIIDPFLQRKLAYLSDDKKAEMKMSTVDQFHFVRTKELMAVGDYENALKEVRMIGRRVSINTPKKILWVGNLYLTTGGFINSQSMMEGFLRELPEEKHLELSSEYWKLFFPIAFRELVAEFAEDFKLDPFLIEGLMRQESSFNPDSLSRSGAIGLMQLMPATGENEFRKKYKGKFYEDVLFIPRINISLGSQHLAYLLKKAKGDTILALAGYNAGLTRALRWKRTLKTSDPDVFIEKIPFRETKKYVKKVLRNYFNYTMLYGNGDEKDKVLALNMKDL